MTLAQQLKQEGLQQGLQQGEQSKALAIATIARNLLKQKVALSTIKIATGLSEQELVELEDS